MGRIWSAVAASMSGRNLRPFLVKKAEYISKVLVSVPSEMIGYSDSSFSVTFRESSSGNPFPQTATSLMVFIFFSVSVVDLTVGVVTMARSARPSFKAVMA